MSYIELKNGRKIGDQQPCYIIAEIGINHNGSLEITKKLIDAAVDAKCDAVKFQKRTPELCVPRHQWDMMRDTPWGRMTYLEYKKKIEFGLLEYAEIDLYCKSKGIDWFASCWDEESVDFIEQFDPIMYKVASASLTDHALIEKMVQTQKPIMISTGMSTMEEIEIALKVIPEHQLMVAHATSAYPCEPKELNLKMIQTLKNLYPLIPIGYSGHETGLATTVCAVNMGAHFIERHFTLDRAMWGSDHAASVEPGGMARLVKDIRDCEMAMGDGVKRVYESELSSRERLRKISTNISV